MSSRSTTPPAHSAGALEGGGRRSCGWGTSSEGCVSSQQRLVRRPDLQVVVDLDARVEPDPPVRRVTPDELPGGRLRHPGVLVELIPAHQPDMLPLTRRMGRSILPTIGYLHGGRLFPRQTPTPPVDAL